MAQRAGVSFELERLDVEGDELVVSGHWSGVRGLRFVRPTLVVDDRRILATLEHKPWAPSVDRPWTAAFPWNRKEVDVDALALAVSPQVTVALGDAPIELAPEPEPKPKPKSKAEPKPEPVLQPEPEPEPEPPPPLALLPPRSAELDRIAALEDALDEAVRARAAAERDRDRALAQLSEAVADREAAIRTRARMQIAHDEAIAARETAEAALADARAKREEANSQRDEVLLAYRALQRHVRKERAQEERSREDVADADQDGEEEEPIGVRRMPAARTVMAELQRPAAATKLPFSSFDLWVIRIFGTVAGGCFILLLVSILRVFI